MHSQKFTLTPKLLGPSIFNLQPRPNFAGIFDLCIHWVFVVRGVTECYLPQENIENQVDTAKSIFYGYFKMGDSSKGHQA